MADTLNESGLIVMSLPELTASITTSLQTIYGSDINVDSNSPDGQMIGIYSQTAIDQREVLLDIYNMFSVENSYGVNLDNLVSLNGITRTGATYTSAPVAITVDRALTLPALTFLLQDSAGFQWALAAEYTFGAAGTATLTFNCTTPGAVSPGANTIIQQATAVVGVTGVNNPSIAAVVIGVNEQTDADLKITRAKSFKLAAQGPSAAITAALLAAGASDAIVYENNTAGTVGVIPANSIYVIVNPASIFASQIAYAIANKKMPGTGMYGAQTYYTPMGANVWSTMKWDNAVAQALYVKATLIPRKAGETFDTDAVKAAIAAIVYSLGQTASIGDIITAIIGYNSDIIPTVVGVCATLGGSYTDTLAPALQKNYFTISAANITLS